MTDVIPILAAASIPSLKGKKASDAMQHPCVSNPLSTALDAAKIAKKSSAKKLLLGHYSARYNSIAEFEKEAKTIFNNVIAVKDGDTFEIEIVK